MKVKQKRDTKTYQKNGGLSLNEKTERTESTGIAGIDDLISMASTSGLSLSTDQVNKTIPTESSSLSSANTEPIKTTFSRQTVTNGKSN